MNVSRSTLSKLGLGAAFVLAVSLAPSLDAAYPQPGANLGANALNTGAGSNVLATTPPIGMDPSGDPHLGPATNANGASATSSNAQTPVSELLVLDKKLASLDAEEKSLKAELANIGPRKEALHAQVVTRGRDFYKLARAGMLPVGGGFEELVRHAMNLERSRRVLSASLDEEAGLGHDAATLAERITSVDNEKAKVASDRQKLGAAMMSMDDENRRSEAFARAFKARVARGSYQSGDSVIGSGGGGGGVLLSQPDDSPRTGFVQQKGRLLFPVSGRADVRSAHREGTDGPGLEIVAPAGTAVRAVFGGRVAFADKYGPYGRLVILDHGDHYYSVCGNLANIDVRVGDEVEAGARIGTVGDDGQGAMLYFEVRRGTETIAPRPWLGI